MAVTCVTLKHDATYTDWAAGHMLVLPVPENQHEYNLQNLDKQEA